MEHLNNPATWERSGSYSRNGELATVATGLPDTIRELAPFVAVQEQLVEAARKLLRTSNLDPQEYQRILKKGQQQGELVLDAELKIKYILENTPKATAMNNPTGKKKREPQNDQMNNLGQEKKTDVAEAIKNELGFSDRQFRYFKNLTPEAVEKAKAAARENNDIPTRSLAIQIARQERKDNQLETAKQSIIKQTNGSVKENPPIVRLMDCAEFINKCKPYDLLLTDPPYSTDIEDIEGFIDKWLYIALSKVKPTGSAYIFIGAYPNELKAYLNAKIPDNVHLEQVLIWTYKNTGGKIPNEHYKQNYQACLFYRGLEAGQLDNKDNEFWAVTEMNAPDGRVGDRYHAWQKPIELAEMYIRHSTKQGDRVIDPFCCTGTFPLAAAKLGRIGLGADTDINNLKIAAERGCVLG